MNRGSLAAVLDGNDVEETLTTVVEPPGRVLQFATRPATVTIANWGPATVYVRADAHAATVRDTAVLSGSTFSFHHAPASIAVATASRPTRITVTAGGAGWDGQ